MLSDGQQFHLYQQCEQPLTLNNRTHEDETRNMSTSWLSSVTCLHPEQLGFILRHISIMSTSCCDTCLQALAKQQHVYKLLRHVSTSFGKTATCLQTETHFQVTCLQDEMYKKHI